MKGVFLGNVGPSSRSLLRVTTERFKTLNCKINEVFPDFVFDDPDI